MSDIKGDSFSTAQNGCVDFERVLLLTVKLQRFDHADQ